MPKHVGDYYVIKTTFINPSTFVGPFKKIYTYHNYTVRAVTSAFDVGYDRAAVGLGVTLRPFTVSDLEEKNRVKLNAVFCSSGV